MPNSRVVARIAVGLLACILLGACASHRTLTREEITHATERDARRFAGFERNEGQRVGGYVTRDGREHRFDGVARLDGDTMVFRGAGRSRMRVERVALTDLQSVRSEAPNHAGTVMVVIGAVVTGLMIYTILFSDFVGRIMY